jgi:hypothetical protein
VLYISIILSAIHAIHGRLENWYKVMEVGTNDGALLLRR